MRLKAAIASRIKVMASLDIAERRLPQDGVIKLKTADGKENQLSDFGSATVFGEKVVLRLLAKGSSSSTSASSGMDPDAYHHFKEGDRRAVGDVAGDGADRQRQDHDPLFGVGALNKVERNISSAEDPVEIYLRGINQVNVNEPIGLTFGAVLRSFLRQDPDVLMVGEIRDFETIEIASRRRSPGTWCSRPFTPTTLRRPSDACSTWASIPSWSRPR